MSTHPEWWRDAVVYQVYPRSFQDSDGDGEGDLRGVASRLQHVARLGADAIWLSPFYRSPFADGGYDVAGYTEVDPRFGTLADADALIAAAHARGLRVLFDIVPCHTSIEHPWFREHPERYVWSDRDGPQNNWCASFGGRAWSRDARSGRWYLHSFYPEQPDLDWRRDDVRTAMADVMRFWIARGVDGFRLDAIDRLMKDPQLRDDPPATGPPALPEQGDCATLDMRHSRNAPDIGEALAVLREGAGEGALLVGEVYLPADAPRALPRARRRRVRVRAAARALGRRAPCAPRSSPGLAAGSLAWVLSNHDFPRLPDRVGARERSRRRAARADAARSGVRLPGRRDRDGRRAGPRAARRPRRPRPPPPPDALGRRRAARRASRAASRGCRRSRSTAARSRRRNAIATRCSPCTATSSPCARRSDPACGSSTRPRACWPTAAATNTSSR